jgi:cytochrome c
VKLSRLILVTGLLAAAVAHAQSTDVPALLEKYGCSSCHAKDEAITGPAYVDVAAKYRGDPHASAILVALVRKGAHGDGPWPMPPSPQVPAAVAREMVAYILALK